MASEPGIRTFLMLHPVRIVVPSELPDSLPCTLRVSTRSHFSVVIAPSPETGPTAFQVPLTGHNLTLTISADSGEDVTVERLDIRRVRHSVLDADGISIIQSQFMPPFSADFVDAALQSMAAYRPLRPPDYEIDLDSTCLRRLDGAERTLPLRVASGDTTSLVVAPITDIRDLVCWTLAADVHCAGNTNRICWEMNVTAQTFMHCLAGPHAGTLGAVHNLFPDHWHRGASREDIASGAVLNRTAITAPATHSSADGTGFLRRPVSDREPEPDTAKELRERGNRYALNGEMDRARTAYVAAAEAGSAEAAYWLGFLVETAGDAGQALHWYTVAAQGDFVPAFNDLAVLHFRRGELDLADHWYRRGMDAGDWTAAAGLGTLLRQRGDPEAETVLRMVAGTAAGFSAAQIIGDALAASDAQASALAADLLAELLHEQGRTDEAIELWEQAAGHGNARAALNLGEHHLAQGNRAEAERWWRQSAETGNQLSACRLGDLFHGDGNPTEAERWWRTAAESLEKTLAEEVSTVDTDAGRQILVGKLTESGEVRAAYDLGMSLLRRGQTTEAQHWLQLAAQAGHRAARYELPDELDADRHSHEETTDGSFVEPMSRAIRQGNWLVLPESNWEPHTLSDRLPSETMVGGWRLDDTGASGPFQPNPHYMPTDRSMPSDPVHELLRLVAAGRTDGAADRLLPILRNTIVDIAFDGQDNLLLGPAPDGVTCVAIVTAAIHKRRMPDTIRWRTILGGNLPHIVPHDIDILINPGDSGQFRLVAAVLRRDGDTP
jgi:TPR repeat protein